MSEINSKIYPGAQEIRIASHRGETHLFASHTPTHLCFYRRQDREFYTVSKSELLPPGGWEIVQALENAGREFGEPALAVSRRLLHLYQLVLMLRPMAGEGSSAFDLAERLLRQEA